MFWSKTMTDRLESLWKDGVPISDIGRKLSIEFDTVITRNSAVAKATRMGFAQKYPREAPANIGGNTAPVPQHYRRPRVTPAETARPASVQRATPPRRVVDLAPPLPVAETEATRCRWLDGEVEKTPKPGLGRAHQRKSSPDVMSQTGPVYACWADVPRCPHERVDGKPYCGAHCDRAYQRIRPEDDHGSE